VPVDEVRIGVDVVERWSVVGVDGQQPTDEVAGGPQDMGRDRELVADDTHVGLFECGRLERRSTTQQGVPM